MSSLATVPSKPFALTNDFSSPFRRALMSAATPALERVLAFPTLNGMYAELAAREDIRHFSERALEALGVEFEISEEEQRGIPSAGPLIVVSNHPFGGIDGLVLTALLRRVRPDSKILGNSLLRRIPDLSDTLIFVDPFGGSGAPARNLSGLRTAIRWVSDGGALGVFPAGEVSQLDLRRRRVTDPPWSETIAALVRLSRAPVLTVFFEGRNSSLFQTLGLVHPLLRTVMLPRELLRRRRSRVSLRVGTLIPHARLQTFSDDRELADYLRVRTYILSGRAAVRAGGARPGLAVEAPVREVVSGSAGRGGADPARAVRTEVGTPGTARSRGSEPAGRTGAARHVVPQVSAPLTAAVAAPVAAAEPIGPIVREIASLPADQQLLESGPHLVAYARAGQIPCGLREIGRLREIAFREVGEGTGNARDIDRFDAHYIHLFVWDRKASAVVGAYRLGPTDEILPRLGKSGLYTSTLFRFRTSLLDQIDPALELGRSFIRPEYQKEHSPLALLWKGIGRFTAANPRYRRLFGPVSISNDYQSMSRQLLMTFLQVNRSVANLGRLLRPRNRPRPAPARDWDPAIVSTIVRELDEVGTLISEIESDRKSIPVLLRQYLKLNGVLLGFNVDPDFGDVLDGLMLVDLAKVDRPILNRYMDRVNAAAFLAHHELSG